MYIDVAGSIQGIGKAQGEKYHEPCSYAAQPWLKGLGDISVRYVGAHVNSSTNLVRLSEFYSVLDSCCKMLELFRVQNIRIRGHKSYPKETHCIAIEKTCKYNY